MSVINLFSASDFKAHCLELLDRIADRAVDRVTITKRGRVVGVLVPPDDDADAVRGLHGFMRGSVTVPADVDLTAPILDEAFAAADGIPHG
jgi:prevent-host-death family protein